MIRYKTFLEKLIYENIHLPYGQSRLNRGPLIVFEGIDFSGKTTICNMLAKHIDSTYNLKSKLYKEPTDKNILRSILKEEEILKYFSDFSIIKNNIKDIFNYYIFMASRCHSMSLVCKDMKDKNIVILDRSFISTEIYQNKINNLLNLDILDENMNLYSRVSSEFGFTDNFSFPDIIVYLKLDEATYFDRMELRESKIDNFDSTNIKDVSEKINLYEKTMNRIKSNYSVKTHVVEPPVGTTISDTAAFVCESVDRYLASYDKCFTRWDKIYGLQDKTKD